MKVINMTHKMREKNGIIDFVKNWEDGIYNKDCLIYLIEYSLGFRDAIVGLAGEDTDNLFVNFLADNIDDYILLKEGIFVASKDFEKLKTLLDNLGNEQQLGILLGYPQCCVEKWCALNTGEETAMHRANMQRYFGWLSYVPCSKDCKESIRRNDKIKEVIFGKDGGG